MTTRREALQISLAAALLAALPRSWAAATDGPMKRAIPRTGQQVPVVGLGSSATFSQLAGAQETGALREVIAEMARLGGTVFDTAPSYGASEQVAGDIARELKLTDAMFWATKVNVAGRGGGAADPAAARAQIESSFAKLGKQPIDLIQVHNLGDVPVQLGILKELREAGRVRHIGVTTTFPAQYPQLIEVMQAEPLDFIGIDYAIDNRAIEERILPLAQEKGIAVMVYLPFGRTRLWERVRGKDVPEWAAEFDARSWAQFFLKFVLAHPAVTVVTPATSKVKHMADNLGAAYGRLPDAAMRERMAAHVAAL